MSTIVEVAYEVVYNALKFLMAHKNLSEYTALIFCKENCKKKRDIKMNDSIIRSRVQWYNEGEKPTRFFCSIESHNFT